MENLKPCPFCGGEIAIEEEWADSFSSFFTFQCDECGMYVTHQYCVSETEAIEAWNRRAGDGK